MDVGNISQVQSDDSGDKSGKTFEKTIAILTHGASSRPGVRARSEDMAPEPAGVQHHEQTYSHSHFKVYKRRWLGLGQLVLLNVVVSWDVRLYPLLTSSQATSRLCR